MTGIFIQNEDSLAEISANQYYGADFKASIIDKDGNYIVENLSLTEIEAPLSSNFSGTVTSNYSISDQTIELNDTTNLGTSDRIKVKNYIYRITNINGNNVTLHKGLYENILADDTVTKKGNLGIFKGTFNISDLGKYTLIGSDSIFGLNTNKMIKVVPKSIETMYKDIKNLEYAILGS